MLAAYYMLCSINWLSRLLISKASATSSKGFDISRPAVGSYTCTVPSKEPQEDCRPPALLAEELRVASTEAFLQSRRLTDIGVEQTLAALEPYNEYLLNAAPDDPRARITQNGL